MVLDLKFYNSLSWAGKAIIYCVFTGYDINKDGALILPYNIPVDSIQLEKRGYLCLGVKIPERKTSCNVYLHRYQAFKKYGLKIFEKGIQVRHKNNNKLDNSWDNILIGTARDNYYDNPVEENYKNYKNFLLSGTQANRDNGVDLWKKIYNDRQKNMLTYDQLCDKYHVSKSSLSYHFGKGKRKVNQEYVKMIKNIKAE